uniref:Uncharacterized protein n=1 Tax=Zooxanthella nutricula TaxID=1333877 RepID=A0A6V0I4Z8_9DINO
MIAFSRIMAQMALPSHEVRYNPEDYAAASGELLVFNMIISWVLTYLFNPAVIDENELKARVGYNNLCVGWDTMPAKFVAAPLFAVIIFFQSRFLQLDYWRAALLGQRVLVVRIVNFVCAASWFFAIGIFSIDAAVNPLGHTFSFVQLVIFSYVAFCANLVEVDPRFHPKGAYPFVAIFGVISILFGICAMIQMYKYDPLTGAMGPVPWHLMCLLDYGYFACMGLQGFFRPRAPSLQAPLKLISDDDFQVTPEMNFAQARFPMPPMPPMQEQKGLCCGCGTVAAGPHP